MSLKSIIAVDIDDVLADHAQQFVDFSNKRWETNLTVDDYDEHWAAMWKLDRTEALARADDFFRSGVIAQYNHANDALPVLTRLSRKYHLIVITSRRLQIEKESRAWIASHYPGVFSEIHFSGIWDKIDDKTHLQTKAEICQKFGVTYLIDDQLKHCIAAAKNSMKGLLFGEYIWNQSAELPKNVVRVKDWEAVEEYFSKEESYGSKL
jgi:uncharacterized HAD superfamily protein